MWCGNANAPHIEVCQNQQLWYQFFGVSGMLPKQFEGDFGEGNLKTSNTLMKKYIFRLIPTSSDRTTQVSRLLGLRNFLHYEAQV